MWSVEKEAGKFLLNDKRPTEKKQQIQKKHCVEDERQKWFRCGRLNEESRLTASQLI